jgi:hypothetical protein
MRMIAKSLIKSFPVSFQCSSGINVTRTAVFIDNVLYSNIFGEKLIISVIKIIHGYLFFSGSDVGSDLGSGSGSGSTWTGGAVPGR